MPHAESAFCAHDAYDPVLLDDACYVMQAAHIELVNLVNVIAISVHNSAVWSLWSSSLHSSHHSHLNATPAAAVPETTVVHVCQCRVQQELLR